MRVSLQNIFNIYRFLCVRDPFTYRHSIAISTVSVLLFTFDSLNRIQTKRLSFKKKRRCESNTPSFLSYKTILL